MTNALVTDVPASDVTVTDVPVTDVLVTIIAVTDVPLTSVPVKNLFSKKRKEVYLVPQPTKEQREAFFRPLFRIKALKAPPKPKPKREEMEILLEAPPTPPPQLTPEEMQARFREEENTLRELRIFLRQICAKLARNKQFYMFSKPVDVEEVPDYLSVIKEPMDLETMMTKIDHHKYTCAQDFLNDIDLMCANALEYNPDRNPADKQIRHRACYLQDTAYALIKAEMDSDFEDNCRKIRDDRKKLEVKTEATATVAPAVVKTEDMDVQSHDAKTVESSDAKISPGASTSGALSSSGLKRKRHNKSPWSKGFLGKKKKTPTNGSNPSASRASTENDVPDAGPAGQSTPQKNRSSNLSDAAGDGSHLDESRLLDNSLTMNGYITGATEDTEEETTGTPKVVKIDRPALNRLLEETVEVTATRNGHDQLTDLYGLMSEAINAYKFKWDRTNLIQELQKLLREFSAGETSSEDEGQSHTQQQPSPC
ncbi:ATPase family associated with various cellular activities (AAA) [Nesidiocoris tenuis]|uniref:ATPase family associated with various cellular activities (AAA) n=1 Tax=Nesidiocoris tenuis TaxID=355587 RepID=A0ABN7BGJ4_9HEMI|nr:ATPase family associated with various cellular activities (AAA) [Nesidiocoris tenuis]